MSPLTEDRKLKDLIGRVSDDVSQLRSDIRSLFSHTGRHTLPTGAREFREQARQRLQAGGAYVRQHPTQSSIGLAGGLLILGAVGAGIYLLCKSDSCLISQRGNHSYDDAEELDIG
jgi:ElaB/YqjD/DUF883 family membrane-anchored ribosome-binding protein